MSESDQVLTDINKTEKNPLLTMLTGLLYFIILFLIALSSCFAIAQCNSNITESMSSSGISILNFFYLIFDLFKIPNGLEILYLMNVLLGIFFLYFVVQSMFNLFTSIGIFVKIFNVNVTASETALAALQKKFNSGVISFVIFLVLTNLIITYKLPVLIIILLAVIALVIIFNHFVNTFFSKEKPARADFIISMAVITAKMIFCGIFLYLICKFLLIGNFLSFVDSAMSGLFDRVADVDIFILFYKQIILPTLQAVIAFSVFALFIHSISEISKDSHKKMRSHLFTILYISAGLILFPLIMKYIFSINLYLTISAIALFFAALAFLLAVLAFDKDIKEKK